MFYVKEKTDEIEVKVELNSENVFCACPDCGKEVAVDLSCVFADGLGDMYGTAVLCNECAWKRLHVKLKEKRDDMKYSIEWFYALVSGKLCNKGCDRKPCGKNEVKHG